MKHLVKLSIEIELELTNKNYFKLVSDAKALVTQNCFKGNTRRVTLAKFIDTELLDDTIDTKALMQQRLPTVAVTEGIAPEIETNDSSNENFISVL